MEVRNVIHAVAALLRGVVPYTHYVGGWLNLSGVLVASEKRKIS